MYPGPVLAEQVYWVFMSFSAGFCEEVVYRGFGITALRARCWATWLAVLLATLAFVFVHGVAGAFQFPAYFGMGLLFAAVYLGTRSLVPGICLHTAIDLGAILLG
jgi:membrane protease YdiL (CAAX protease family)